MKLLAKLCQTKPYWMGNRVCLKKIVVTVVYVHGYFN